MAKKLADTGLTMTPKQIRARARRSQKRNQRLDDQIGAAYKPIEDWDDEELSRGAPREVWGTSQAARLAFIPRATHEQIVGKFQEVVRGKMREMTIPALTTLTAILSNEAVDKRGRPMVPPGVKKDIAFFLIEHVVGKPTQRVEGELSVKLQGILAHVMAVPGEEGGEKLSGFQGLPAPTADDEATPPVSDPITAISSITASLHAAAEDEIEIEDDDA